MATIDNRQFTERVIDVSNKPIVSRVVREGVEVIAPTVDVKKVDDLITRLKPPLRTQLPRVVGQSVPAGTRVARGSVVELTFIRPEHIELNVLAEVHADMITKTVADVVARIADPEVTRILNTRATAAEVTNEERVKIVAALPVGTQIDDTKPEKSFARALTTLQSVRAFK